MPAKSQGLVVKRGRLSMQPEDLQLLVTRSMPFGKYKGRLIADLPGDYLRWFARAGVPKGKSAGCRPDE